jgi:iron complex transport system substrate-binding protein
MAPMTTYNNFPQRNRTCQIPINRAVLPVLLCLLMALLPGMATAATTAAEETAQNDTGGYQRIISLYSAHTENLVSMGAADQLVGISPSDNYPEHILDKQRFSYREDPERFIAARPDLVLVRPMIERSYPQLMDKLREIGIHVVSLQPTTVEGIFDYWRDLGRLSGHPTAAEEMIEQFSSRLDTFATRVDGIAMEKRPRVYFESMHRRMKTFAPSSIALFALKMAGGINVATDASQVRSTNIAAYSKERILAHADEIDVFIAQQGRMNPVTLETIRNETGFQAIKAVRRDNIFLIDEHLVSRPTMRLLQGIEQLHEQLYGQASLTEAGS